MKNIKIIFIIAVFFLSLCVSNYAQIIIPDEVKTVLENGLESSEPRLDIPFEIKKHLFMPAGENVHSVFIFKLKVPETGTSLYELYKKGSVSFHVFIQFIQFIENAPPAVTKEVYVPATFHVGKFAKQNDFYTVAYPMPSGNYILAMAIASEDLKLIGTQYFEFSLPNFVTSDFDITPVFFVDKIERKKSAETKVSVHKNYASYSILNISPKIENTFSPVDTLDLFFIIYGIKSNSFIIEYGVFKENEKLINFEKTRSNTPLISQQLPLLETHNLYPGLYTLLIDITDINSGRKIFKRVNFKIR